MNVLRWALLSAMLLGAAGCGSSVNPAMYARFQAAQEHFERADQPREFLQAAALYQEILDAGVVSGAVLYNQGNAFMRAGQRGRAIACYRQAQRYRPRDPYLDANLRYALSESGALSDVGTSRPKLLVEYILFWSNWISYHGKFQASLAGALITFGLSVASLFVQPKRLKRIAAITLCVAMAMAISAVYDWYRFSHLRHGVIVADEAIARKGDSESYQPAFTKPLGEGTEFLVLDQRNGWTQLRLEGQQDGWVPNEDVTVY